MLHFLFRRSPSIELRMSSDSNYYSNHENPRFFSPGLNGIAIEEILCVTIDTHQERLEQLKSKRVFKSFINFEFVIENNVI